MLAGLKLLNEQPLPSNYMLMLALADRHGWMARPARAARQSDCSVLASRPSQSISIGPIQCCNGRFATGRSNYGIFVIDCSITITVSDLPALITACGYSITWRPGPAGPYIGTCMYMRPSRQQSGGQLNCQIKTNQTPSLWRDIFPRIPFPPPRSQPHLQALYRKINPFHSLGSMLSRDNKATHLQQHILQPEEFFASARSHQLKKGLSLASSRCQPIARVP